MKSVFDETKEELAAGFATLKEVFAIGMAIVSEGLGEAKDAIQRIFAGFQEGKIMEVVFGVGELLLAGLKILGGLLAGVTVSGVLMAIFQSNAGGAWDNAKKMVEEGVEVAGEAYEKGSDVHKATVVGDTVGDPFKDTSGPSLNILIKLMSVVSLVIAPLIA